MSDEHLSKVILKILAKFAENLGEARNRVERFDPDSERRLAFATVAECMESALLAYDAAPASQNHSSKAAAQDGSLFGLSVVYDPTLPPNAVGLRSGSETLHFILPPTTFRGRAMSDVVDDAMVEAIAKVLYEGDHPDYDPPWDRVHESIRAHFCKQTRAALEAALPMIGEKLAHYAETVDDIVGLCATPAHAAARIRELTRKP